MKCANHPVSPAVGTCAACNTALCGVCASFVDQAVYCEKCEKVREAEKFVADQKAHLDRPVNSEKFSQVDALRAEREEQARLRRRNTQLLVIGLCAVIIGARLFFWFSSQRQAEMVALPDLGLPATALPECLMVFQEIGELLANGGQPLPTMRCVDSSVPNVVSRQDGAVKVSHPNPGAYGLSELYVTSSNPVPQLVD